MTESGLKIGVGHVRRLASDVSVSESFYRRLGLRTIEKNPQLAILEMRGGTHLMLFSKSDEFKDMVETSFDLMVEDIEDFHSSLEMDGIKGSPIKKKEVSGHFWFQITDPDGYDITIYSSHTEGRSV